MIYVDANVFLRHLVQPVTPQDAANAALATALLEDAEHDRVTLTTTDAAIAEVVFILSHRRHDAFPRARVAGAVVDLLDIAGLRMPSKRACLRAVEIWEADEKLSFPDALGVASSELEGYAVATFDRALAKHPGAALHPWST